MYGQNGARMTVTLSFYSRVMLSQIIGNYPAANLKQASVYIRILDKMRITDPEVAATGMVVKDSRIHWELPTPDYGDKEVSFEIEEAAAIVVALDNSPLPIKIGDAVWMTKLVDDLSPKPVLVGAPELAKAY